MENLSLTSKVIASKVEETTIVAMVLITVAMIVLTVAVIIKVLVMLVKPLIVAIRNQISCLALQHR